MLGKSFLTGNPYKRNPLYKHKMVINQLFHQNHWVIYRVNQQLFFVDFQYLFLH